MSSTYVVFGHWLAKPEKVDELLEAFKPVLESISNETDGILSYYLLKEHKDNETASKTKLRITDICDPPQRSHLDHVCEEKSLLTTTQNDQFLIGVAGFPFRSPDPSKSRAPNLHTMMAKITYVAGTRADGIRHWRGVARSVKETEEDGTHAYWFLADPEDENVLYSLELYKDKEYLWDVHVSSDAIQGNIQAQKGIRTGLELRVFKTVV